MNSSEINKILQNNIYTKNYFKGVYPSNNIPSLNQFPFTLIVNTDPLGQPGTHWVAIYAINQNSAEYFDSFGNSPNTNIGSYLNRFKDVNRNKTKIQSIFDNSCGAHVIYYTIQKCRGSNLETIIKELNNPYSDSLVKLYVYNLISQT
jgi:hypothetical protein